MKEQTGHSSIQVTVDTYGHLIPGANVAFVDTLDVIPEGDEKTSPHQSASPAQQAVESDIDISAEVIERLVAAVGLEPTT